MPETLESHVEYTRREWESPYYQDCINYINDKLNCTSFVDLGGCVGEVTNVIMERISSLKTFHIVEPVRENFEFIVKKFNGNIEANELENYYSIEIEDKVATFSFTGKSGAGRIKMKKNKTYLQNQLMRK